jgi:hypothetical protein
VRQKLSEGHGAWQGWPQACWPTGQIWPPQVGTWHWLPSMVQLPRQEREPVASGFPVKVLQVAPPRSLPSHCSAFSFLLLPQIGAGMMHWLLLRVQLALQLTVPMALEFPVTEAHVAPPRSVLSHCSPPFFTPSPQLAEGMVH